MKTDVMRGVGFAWWALYRGVMHAFHNPQAPPLLRAWPQRHDPDPGQRCRVCAIRTHILMLISDGQYKGPVSANWDKQGRFACL